ncbi:MAG: uroporphyrinogen-III synthase [Parachlamydiaceae bacterium]|nr:uroporphyrinogen-III synthase [Parachlamydiaceae bacterium]
MKKRKILYTGLDPSHCKCDGEIIHIPLIKIEPVLISDPNIQKSISQFNEYTHVIITSKSVIPILGSFLTSFGFSINDWKKKLTIAVGQVTGHHLRQIGIEPEIIAQEETAEGIVKELNKLSLKNSCFFWPHSAQSRTVLSNYFEKRKIHYNACNLYHTQTAISSPLPDITIYDEIIFTSPSTIKAFLEIFGSLPQGVVLTSIGPVTKAYLENINSLLSSY